MIAYVPFINSLEEAVRGADALDIYFVIPLVIGISVVYKSTKVANLRDIPRHAAIMSGQIIVVMVLAAFVLYGVVALIVRHGPS